MLIFHVLQGVCKVVVRLWAEERNTVPLIDIRTCLFSGVAIINRCGRWDEVDMKISGEFFGVPCGTLPFSFLPVCGGTVGPQTTSTKRAQTLPSGGGHHDENRILTSGGRFAQMLESKIFRALNEVFSSWSGALEYEFQIIGKLISCFHSAIAGSTFEPFVTL